MDKHVHLSRRERQIMDVIYAHGQASVNHIRDELPDPPSHTAIRTLLRILEGKGHVKHVKRGRELIYTAVRSRRIVGQSALRRVIKTFFDGSLEKAVGAHMADRAANLSREELEQVIDLIQRASEQED